MFLKASMNGVMEIASESSIFSVLLGIGRAMMSVGERARIAAANDFAGRRPRAKRSPRSRQQTTQVVRQRNRSHPFGPKNTLCKMAQGTKEALNSRIYR